MATINLFRTLLSEAKSRRLPKSTKDPVRKLIHHLTVSGNKPLFILSMEMIQQSINALNIKPFTMDTLCTGNIMLMTQPG